ncbi:MAG: AbrB/MazE/SpoVT family DNA-binding domain-containing protein [Chloroflexi bacterium]|nr:AbrB/MazE/SpoVT family DNA-binding domain-containing protein [Chloroflexota bacterium]
MNTVFKTRIVKIGNSQGIRIPKIFLDEISLEEEVELELQPDQIVIRRARKAREGWEHTFQIMAEQGDDRLIDNDSIATSSWDEDEWTW